MRTLFFTCALLLAIGAVGTAFGADLTKIDRTIDKEPHYDNKPKYCLLVFGAEAKTRVWLILDSDVLYVDRNGNRDLTEKGERHAGVKYLEGSKEAIRWDIGDILEVDGRTRHTKLRVTFRRGSFGLSLRTARGIHQEVGNEFGPMRYSDKAMHAPIVHFAGPLTFLLASPPNLIPGEEAHFTALIGTLGLGAGAAAYCHTDDFEKVKMVGEVQFPQLKRSSPPRVRCAYEGY